MATNARKRAASPCQKGGCDGQAGGCRRWQGSQVSTQAVGPQRTAHSARGVGHPVEVVAARAGKSVGDGPVSSDLLKSGVSLAAGTLGKLIERVHRVAVDLAYKSDKAAGCFWRPTWDATEGLSVLQRIEMGDREAIHDAIVEASNELGVLREQIDRELSDGEPGVLLRAAELRSLKAAGKSTDAIVLRQEAAATDRGGKERQRIAASKGKASANHG